MQDFKIIIFFILYHISKMIQLIDFHKDSTHSYYKISTKKYFLSKRFKVDYK